jgi:hypothetical protein
MYFMMDCTNQFGLMTKPVFILFLLPDASRHPCVELVDLIITFPSGINISDSSNIYLFFLIGGGGGMKLILSI